LVRATSANAALLYRALEAFGVRLSAFEVSEGDFSSYDGMLQIGVPPLRFDIINRVDGIIFDEEISDGVSIEPESCTIPIIGRLALLKNKRGIAGAKSAKSMCDCFSSLTDCQIQLSLDHHLIITWSCASEV